MDDDWKKLHEAAAKKLAETEYDAIANKSYELGQIVGIQDQAAALREEAGKLYAAGKDELASTYRKIADGMDRTAKVKRDKYDENYKA